MQDILEVGIGLIFMWLVLSIATMSIHEWIITITKKRAADLEVAIGNMLADPNLTVHFYNHPVIRGLMTVGEKTIGKGKGKGKVLVENKPSYIPAQQFAQALFDIVLTAGTEASLLQQGLSNIRNGLIETGDVDKFTAARDGLDALLDLSRKAAATDAGKQFTADALAKLKAGITKFSADHPAYTTALDDMLVKVGEQKKQIELAYQGSNVGGDGALKDLRRGVVALTILSPGLKQTLNTLFEGAESYVKQGESSLALARTNVENWFTASMDRLGGTFKRNAQKMSFIIGVCLALFLNVDSIALATQLWREPTVRQALVAVADKFTVEHPSGVNIPEGGVDPQTAVQNFRNSFNGLNVPLGWTFVKVKNATCSPFPQENQVFGFTVKSVCYQPASASKSTNVVWWVLVKLLGIGLSGLAAVQGAPFWFDMLSKLINVRGTGAKPEEKKASASGAA